MEAANFLKNGKLVPLSEQQLLDCVGTYYPDSEENSQLNWQPCHGGWPYWAFDYVKHQGGINSEEEYPYDNRNVTQSYVNWDDVRECR